MTNLYTQIIIISLVYIGFIILVSFKFLFQNGLSLSCHMFLWCFVVLHSAYRCRWSIPCSWCARSRFSYSGEESRTSQSRSCCRSSPSSGTRTSGGIWAPWAVVSLICLLLKSAPADVLKLFPRFCVESGPSRQSAWFPASQTFSLPLPMPLPHPCLCELVPYSMSSMKYWWIFARNSPKG